MGTVTHLKATGPHPYVGQLFTHHDPAGFTVTYEVTKVSTPWDITVKVLTCVADPEGKAYKIEIMHPATKQWTKVAECDTREQGLAYLTATNRPGLVSDNRR